MFTTEQIKTAHAKVKSGADYPQYVRDIKLLGVNSYETFVKDGNTIYKNIDGMTISSGPKFESLSISSKVNPENFTNALKAHQQAQSDFPTFRIQCAKNGVEKWIADLDKMTCTYYDVARNILLVETIPS